MRMFNVVGARFSAVKLRPVAALVVASVLAAACSSSTPVEDAVAPRVPSTFPSATQPSLPGETAEEGAPPLPLEDLSHLSTYEAVADMLQRLALAGSSSVSLAVVPELYEKGLTAVTEAGGLAAREDYMFPAGIAIEGLSDEELALWGAVGEDLALVFSELYSLRPGILAALDAGKYKNEAVDPLASALTAFFESDFALFRRYLDLVGRDGFAAGVSPEAMGTLAAWFESGSSGLSAGAVADAFFDLAIEVRMDQELLDLLSDAVPALSFRTQEAG